MLRVFSPTGIYFKFTPFRSVLNQDLQDFQDYRERLRFGGKGYLKGHTFYPGFPPMRYAAAESQEMKAPFNNNLPTPISDVMVNPQNPVNPDSKPMAAVRRISADGWVSRCPMYFWGSGMKSVKLFKRKMERLHQLQILFNFFGKMRKCYVGFLYFRMPFFFPFKTIISLVVCFFQ